MSLSLCIEKTNSEPFYKKKALFDFHYLTITHETIQGAFLPFKSVRSLSEHLLDVDKYIKFLEQKRIDLKSIISDLDKINSYLKLKLSNNDIQLENDETLLKISKKRRVLGVLRWVLISTGTFIAGGVITALYIVYRYIPINITTGFSSGNRFNSGNQLKLRF